MNQVVEYQVVQGVATLAVSHPPVNALSHAVRCGLAAGLHQAMTDPDVVAILLYCKGSTFFVGADVTEFGKPRQPPLLRDLIQQLDASNKPLVAAMHGKALGGGLEVAMACHYRILHRGAQIGLPEVKLGLIPGAGGTQMLPRLIGFPAALEMILSGAAVKAPKALESGLVDQLFEGDPLQAGLNFLEKLPAAPNGPPRTSERSTKLPENLYSLKAAFAAIEATLSLPFEEGLMMEQQAFDQCSQSPEHSVLLQRFMNRKTVPPKACEPIK